ncbi:hypothetical protein CDAR_84651 [Caerostris darwini]|uniref:Uncharacterized protein n=1 Tax=Caerostris darwini TaxID=1538125 RepID=A0AAV4RRP4_9ARAC|nr:hypothetical protein CDAR_84651 [Caerostris darwini]
MRTSNSVGNASLVSDRFSLWVFFRSKGRGRPVNELDLASSREHQPRSIWELVEDQEPQPGSIWELIEDQEHQPGSIWELAEDQEYQPGSIREFVEDQEPQPSSIWRLVEDLEHHSNSNSRKNIRMINMKCHIFLVTKLLYIVLNMHYC